MTGGGGRRPCAPGQVPNICPQGLWPATHRELTLSGPSCRLHREACSTQGFDPGLDVGNLGDRRQTGAGMSPLSHRHSTEGQRALVHHFPVSPQDPPPADAISGSCFSHLQHLSGGGVLLVGPPMWGQAGLCTSSGGHQEVWLPVGTGKSGSQWGQGTGGGSGRDNRACFQFLNTIT